MTASPNERRSRARRRFLHPAWLGNVRRTSPLSEHWGLDRGTPVDRYYIEQFLEQNRQDIRGRVLEIKDSGYTDRFGAGVEGCDVLDIDASNPRATLIADLAAADLIPADHFNCFVFTQTLQVIYDLRAALAHAYRILCPGGVLLATVPGICRIEQAFYSTDYWRFTVASCSRLFGDIFGTEQTTVRGHGNVLSAMAFLTGMASEELSPRELDAVDARFPIVITVRAIKKKHYGN